MKLNIRKSFIAPATEEAHSTLTNAATLSELPNDLAKQLVRSFYRMYCKDYQGDSDYASRVSEIDKLLGNALDDIGNDPVILHKFANVKIPCS